VARKNSDAEQPAGNEEHKRGAHRLADMRLVSCNPNAHPSTPTNSPSSPASTPPARTYVHHLHLARPVLKLVDEATAGVEVANDITHVVLWRDDLHLAGVSGQAIGTTVGCGAGCGWRCPCGLWARWPPAGGSWPGQGMGPHSVHEGTSPCHALPT